MARYTPPEVAERLGVSVNTVKTWAERAGVGDKKSTGIWQFSDDDLHILEVIRTMRDNGSGLDSITRRLRVSGSIRAEAPPAPVPVPDADEQQQAEPERLSEMERVTELAKAFAQTAHEETTQKLTEQAEMIGELRERLKWITAERDHYQREIGLLKAPPAPVEPEPVPEPAKPAASPLSQRIRHAWRLITTGEAPPAES